MGKTHEFYNTDYRPNTDLQLDIGTSLFRFRRIYCLNLSAGGIDWVWPTSDGSSGDVLTTDGAGTLSLSSASPSFVSAAKWLVD